jgi:hypothetical protein
MNNFDLRKYLIENKLTRNSKIPKESTKLQLPPQKAVKEVNTYNPYFDRLLEAIDRIDSKYNLIEGLISEVSIEQLKTQFVDSGKLSEKVFDQIVNAVGGKTAYATWLAKKVADSVVEPKDIDSFGQYISIFDRHRKKFEKQDLNQYKTGDDISTLVAKAEEIASMVAKDPSKEKGVSKADKYKQYLIGTVDGFNVYKIPKGATNLYGMNCELGKGTEWCTATEKTDEHFKDYVKKGPLYMFINPNSNEKYQFSYESHEYRDKDDKRLLW